MSDVRLRPLRSTSSADLHFAVPFGDANAYTWAAVRFAITCEQLGLNVSALPGPIHASVEDSDRALVKTFMERQASSQAQIKWSHYPPLHLEQELTGRINVEFFCTNYRYGKQPFETLDLWMRSVARNNYRKLPVTQFCADILDDLGIPARRTHLVPLGYSPEIDTTTKVNEQYRQDGFVFLAITGSHDPYRYGTDILLEVFAKTFAGRPDVLLVLKDYGNANVGPIRGWVHEACRSANIVYLSEFESKEDLIALYRGADAFVAPFRGEGFGMKVLDACAVGLPVLAPHYSGPRDYLQADASFLIRFEEVPLGICLDRENTFVPPFARWCEVDRSDLAERMLAVVANPDEARRRGQLARDRTLAQFSWERAAGRLVEAIEAFQVEHAAVVQSRARAGGDGKTVSVVIPTFDRPTQLTKTLKAYERQTLPKKDWEIIIADDGSTYDVGEIVAQFGESIPVSLIKGSQNRGPAAARNAAIPRTRGEIVLFTGDDIVPKEDFLANHANLHWLHASDDVAILGYTGWDAGITVTPLMQYVTGVGGQQFAYDRLEPNTYVSFNYFYTSNVSLKRSLLVAQEELFSEQFSAAAFEDVEFALRLTRAGMRIFYAPLACATHDHAMSDDDVYRRYYSVGRMLLTYCLMHPGEIDLKHKRFPKSLELVSNAVQNNWPLARIAGSGASASFQRAFDSVIDVVVGLPDDLSTSHASHPWSDGLVVNPKARLAGLYEARLELALRQGMADEWMGIPPGTPNVARDLLCAQYVAERYGDVIADIPNTTPLTGLQRRVEWLESSSRYPVSLHVLRTLVRMATSIAKRLR